MKDVSIGQIFLFCFVVLNSRSVLPTNTITGTGIHFNILGYEPCVFNVLEYDPDLYSHDVSKEILVNSHGVLRWTLFQLEAEEAHKYLGNEKRFLDSPHYFWESCSVNIVVAVGKCFYRTIGDVFGSRIYNADNIFIKILGEKKYCRSYETIENPGYGSELVQANILTIYLNFGRESWAQSAYRIPHCFCDNRITITNLTSDVDWKNLREIEKFRAGIKTKEMVPIIAAMDSKGLKIYPSREVERCDFLYRNRTGTEGERVGCNVDHIFLENAGAELNVSIEYFYPFQTRLRLNYKFELPPNW